MGPRILPVNPVVKAAQRRKAKHLHITHLLPILPPPKAEPLLVDEELRQVEQLGDQLLHITGGHLARYQPGGGQLVERPVRQVKVPILELDELLCEGRQPDQDVQVDAGVAVMDGVVVGTHQPSQPRPVRSPDVVILPVPGTASFLLDRYGLPQAAECVRDDEVEVGGGIVCQHPGEDGVLHQIIQCSAGKSVELHQVL